MKSPPIGIFYIQEPWGNCFVASRGLSNPFKRRRRLLSGFYRWLGKRRMLLEERRLQTRRVSVLDRVVRRVVGLVYLLGEYFTAIFTTIGQAVWHVSGRLIIRRFSQWQLEREEKQARSQKKSAVSKLIGAARYRSWRIKKRLQQTAWAQRLALLFRWLARIPVQLSGWIGGGYDALEKRLAQSKYLSWLYYLLHGLRVLAESAYEFTQAWFWTRRFRSLLGGIPALAMSIPLVFCLVWTTLQTPSAKARHYRHAAQQAWEEGDFDTVRLCYRKVQQLGVSVETALFQTALASGEEGDLEAAYQQMQTLVEQFDFAPAKIWIARMLIHDRLDVPWPEARATSQEYLSQVLAIEPKNPICRLLQAAIYRRDGNLQAAIDELEPIAREYPPASITLAELYRDGNQVDEYQQSIFVPLKFYEKRHQDGVALEAAEYVSWANALLVAGQLDRLEHVLAEAAQRHPDHGAVRRQLPRICVRISDAIAKIQLNDPQRQFRLLKIAYQVAPDNPQVLERLALICTREQIAKQVEALFQDDAELALPPSVHAALAIAASKRNDFPTAAHHFQHVHAAHPNSAAACNNLAWVLLQMESSDIERAHKLAQRAVELEPNKASFRETRGQALARLGRWPAAIEDLEFALNRFPNEPAIRESLAAAYEAVGMTEQAAAHRYAERMLTRETGYDGTEIGANVNLSN